MCTRPVWSETGEVSRMLSAGAGGLQIILFLGGPGGSMNNGDGARVRYFKMLHGWGFWRI